MKDLDAPVSINAVTTLPLIAIKILGAGLFPKDVARLRQTSGVAEKGVA